MFARFNLNVDQKLRKNVTLSVSELSGGNNKAQTVRGIHNFSPSKKRYAFSLQIGKS